MSTAVVAGAEPNFPHRPPSELALALGLFLFFALTGVALSLPYILTSFVGLYWGVLAAVVILSMWLRFIPSTCMSGGLIGSLVAMRVLLNTVGMALAATIRFIVSFF